MNCAPRINGSVPHKLISPNFLSGTPQCCRPHFSRRSFHTNMLILCITLGISLVSLLLKKVDDNDDGKKIAFFCLPEVFCDPKICQNACSAGVPSRSPLRQLRTVPRPPSRLARGHPSSDTTRLKAFGASILAPLPLAACAPAQAWCPRCFQATV